jgi:hypothetical protein
MSYKSLIQSFTTRLLKIKLFIEIISNERFLININLGLVA